MTSKAFTEIYEFEDRTRLIVALTDPLPNFSSVSKEPARVSVSLLVNGKSILCSIE